MRNTQLLEMVLTEVTNESLREDLLRHLIKDSGRDTKEIPGFKNYQRKLNNYEILERMKAVTGGTGVSVAKTLGISSQAYHNQKMRGTISCRSIINLHLKTGVSVDWLLGSWNGSSANYLDLAKTEESEVTQIDQAPQQYLSLVEVYDQTTGNVELKWCLTKHHICLDRNNIPIPDDFGALLSLIIRYKDEAGTPERVKNGKKRHFQVRKVLAYVLGEPKIIRRIDAMAKKHTEDFISNSVERPGKTEFRLLSATHECLTTLNRLADLVGLVMIKPDVNAIAWDFLIGAGSVSPRDWLLERLKEFRSA